MSHKHSKNQDSKLLYPNPSLEFVSVDDEAIFYSGAKNGYFGVSGVAADILAIFQGAYAGLSLTDLIDEISRGRSLGPEDKQLILNGVAILIDLGAIYEK
ncbi:hypothetical protein [Burkholderia sp. Bp8963]|uniref:hypothetical protein n=1 Tax=Burkholderia sp. Bp8963 TaxID=2184547 RepID=UPI00163B1961|nr:hypothetical protein [Burkholderia sp. Bp8963]